MWTDLDNILELTVGLLGGIMAVVFLVCWLEDNLDPDPDSPRGLDAVRRWWRSTK